MVPTTLYINLLKAALAFGFTGIVAAIAGYWWRAKWWKNLIGIAIQLERLCLIGVWTLVLISAFWNLNRFNSEILAWGQVALLFLVGIAHWFLYGVFERTHLITVRNLHIPLRHNRFPRLRRLWLKLLKVPDDNG